MAAADVVATHTAPWPVAAAVVRAPASTDVAAAVGCAEDAVLGSSDRLDHCRQGRKRFCQLVMTHPVPFATSAPISAGHASHRMHTSHSQAPSISGGKCHFCQLKINQLSHYEATHHLCSYTWRWCLSRSTLLGRLEVHLPAGIDSSTPLAACARRSISVDKLIRIVSACCLKGHYDCFREKSTTEAEQRPSKDCRNRRLQKAVAAVTSKHWQSTG